MTNEEQRISIADICGWKWDEETVWSPDGSRTARTNLAKYRAPLEEFFPDYPNDLNAMAEAEIACKTGDPIVYYDWLEVLTKKSGTRPWCATAAQRAEAFLRTVGKWKD